MAVFDYSDLFDLYYTSEGIPFTLKNRSIVFPEEEDHPLYGKQYIFDDVPWTVLSYRIYNTIGYWWLLCSLNQSQIFYAERGSEIKYVLPEYLDTLVQIIQRKAKM